MENQDKSLTITTVVAIGVALYLMKKSQSKPVYLQKDLNFEDFEKLKKILVQLKLEYICIYTRNYNTLKRVEARDDTPQLR